MSDLSNTWESRDLPVLRTIARSETGTDSNFGLHAISEATGLGIDLVRASLAALQGEYVTFTALPGDGIAILSARNIRLRPSARRELGLWPRQTAASAVLDDLGVGGEDRTPAAFVLMPFREDLDWLHQALIRAGEIAGVAVTRADDIAKAGVVIDQVKDSIRNADAIIAVATGQNPNVFYELGISEATHRPIIVAASSSDLPFDVRHFRAIFYGVDADDSRRASLPDAVSEALTATLVSQAAERGPSSEGHQAIADSYRVTEETLGYWLPTSVFPPLNSNADGLVVRGVATVPLETSLSDGLTRIDDEIRVSLREALERGRLSEWLVGQLAAWDVQNFDRWSAHGPLNDGSAANLIWRALTDAGDSPISARCLVALPGPQRPRGVLTMLTDVILTPKTLNELRAVSMGIEPGPHLRITLERLYSLLDATVLSLTHEIPTLLRTVGLEVSNASPIAPGCIIYGWPEAIDYFVDLRSIERVSGAVERHGANLVPRDVDASKEEDRRELVLGWLRELLLWDRRPGYRPRVAKALSLTPKGG